MKITDICYCYRCKTHKHHSEFSRKRNGWQDWCKACYSEYRKRAHKRPLLEFEYNGQVFRGFSALSRACGVACTTLRDRYRITGDRGERLTRPADPEARERFRPA